jgi:serine protease AprX
MEMGMATPYLRARLHRFLLTCALSSLVIAGSGGAAAQHIVRTPLPQDLSLKDQMVHAADVGLPEQVEPSADPAGTAGEVQPAQAPSNLLYPSIVTGASDLHTRGITGTGVAVAIIDSGMPAINHSWTQITTNTLAYSGGGRSLVYKDLVTAVPITNSSDPNGHGTHVLATIADARTVTGGNVLGVAPGVDLVVVRALDAQGQAPYSRVIAAIEWVIANKNTYNIRVLNLSLQAPVHGPYWHDPLAQATMAAWQAGITVVVAAGNYGPGPATITVPGNVPYVITVGGIKPGAYTTNGVDQLAVYSSAGPTESKFVKPDVVIAGSRVLAPMPAGATLEVHAGLVKEKTRLKFGPIKSRDDLNYYALSGTSMAAAEVSGVAALLIEDEPALSNDQIKYRLTNTAEVALDSGGNPAYAIWQQGAGRVRPVAAVDGASTAAANAGMNIALDRDYLNGTHYLGNTEYDPQTSSFYFTGQPVGVGSYTAWAGGYTAWAGSYTAWAGGYTAWAGSYTAWAGGYTAWAGSYTAWAGSYTAWAGSTSVWSSSYPSWTGNLVDEGLTTYMPMTIR